MCKAREVGAPEAVLAALVWVARAWEPLGEARLPVAARLRGAARQPEEARQPIPAEMAPATLMLRTKKKIPVWCACAKQWE